MNLSLSEYLLTLKNKISTKLKKKIFLFIFRVFSIFLSRQGCLLKLFGIMVYFYNCTLKLEVLTKVKKKKINQVKKNHENMS